MRPFADSLAFAAVHAMNEITLHRGASPHLIYLDAHVNGEFLTEVVVSDG